MALIKGNQREIFFTQLVDQMSDGHQTLFFTQLVDQTVMTAPFETLFFVNKMSDGHESVSKGAVISVI